MKKKWLLLLLKIVVSGSLIWYLFDSIDLAAAQERLSKVDPMMLLVAASMLLFQMVIGGLRWSAVLRGIGISIPFWEISRLFYIGSFFNQALPGGTGGDVVRIYLVFKGNWGIRGAVNGVLLERVATLLALMILVLCTLPFFLITLSTLYPSKRRRKTKNLALLVNAQSKFLPTPRSGLSTHPFSSRVLYRISSNTTPLPPQVRRCLYIQDQHL